MRHTFECHSSEPNFKFSCLHCHQSFSIYSSMISHLSRKQRFSADVPDPYDTVSETSQIQTQSDLDLDHALENAEFNGDDTSVSSRYLAQKSAALFLLTLKEKYKLTQTALDFAVCQVKHMVSFALEDMKDILRQKFASGALVGKKIAMFDASCNYSN